MSGRAIDKKPDTRKFKGMDGLVVFHVSMLFEQYERVKDIYLQF